MVAGLPESRVDVIYSFQHGKDDSYVFEPLRVSLLAQRHERAVLAALFAGFLVCFSIRFSCGYSGKALFSVDSGCFGPIDRLPVNYSLCFGTIEP